MYFLHCKNSKYWGRLSEQTCRPRSDCSKRSSLIRVYIVCHSICIFCVHSTQFLPSCSILRAITVFLFGVPMFRIFQVLRYSHINLMRRLMGLPFCPGRSLYFKCYFFFHILKFSLIFSYFHLPFMTPLHCCINSSYVIIRKSPPTFIITAN